MEVVVAVAVLAILLGGLLAIGFWMAGRRDVRSERRTDEVQPDERLDEAGRERRQAIGWQPKAMRHAREDAVQQDRVEEVREQERER